MFTTVVNLDTLEEYIYSLPPKMAVIAAFEQFTKKNWNTWTYNYANHPELVHAGPFVTCGNWTARDS